MLTHSHIVNVSTWSMKYSFQTLNKYINSEYKTGKLLLLQLKLCYDPHAVLLSLLSGCYQAQYK